MEKIILMAAILSPLVIYFVVMLYLIRKENKVINEEIKAYNDVKNPVLKNDDNKKPIENVISTPKRYGQYLQQTGRQIWIKKTSKY